MATQVAALAAAARGAAPADAAAEPSAATPAPFGAATGGTAHPAALTADAAAGCVRALTEGDGSTALAVDSGSYQGQPAVVVVIPTKGDPTSLDVFVVRARLLAGLDHHPGVPPHPGLLTGCSECLPA